MLTQLTEYLLQYKTVSIPHVGSFVVERQPAQLHFADKLIHPPAYSITYREGSFVDERQLCFIGRVPSADRLSLQQQLENFGRSLKRRIESDSFTWNGIGLLEWVDNKIVFRPQPHTAGFSPVEANKVIRENAPHTLLVGDQEIQSNEANDLRNTSAERKKDYAIPIARTALALIIALIVFLFFINGFRLESTGLQTKPKIEPVPATHD